MTNHWRLLWTHKSKSFAFFLHFPSSADEFQGAWNHRWPPGCLVWGKEMSQNCNVGVLTVLTLASRRPYEFVCLFGLRNDSLGTAFRALRQREGFLPAAANVYGEVRERRVVISGRVSTRCSNGNGFFFCHDECTKGLWKGCKTWPNPWKPLVWWGIWTINRTLLITAFTMLLECHGSGFRVK